MHFSTSWFYCHPQISYTLHDLDSLIILTCFRFLILFMLEGSQTMRFASNTLFFILGTIFLVSDTSLTSFCQNSCIYLLQHSFIFLSFKLLSSLFLSFMTFPRNYIASRQSNFNYDKTNSQRMIRTNIHPFSFSWSNNPYYVIVNWIKFLMFNHKDIRIILQSLKNSNQHTSTIWSRLLKHWE